MIIQISLRSFTLYSFEIAFLSYSNAQELFDARKKSSMYTLIMNIAPFLCATRIVGLAFSSLKSGVLRNLMIFWFYRQPDCFKP